MLLGGLPCDYILWIGSRAEITRPPLGGVLLTGMLRQDKDANGSGCSRGTEEAPMSAAETDHEII